MRASRDHLRINRTNLRRHGLCLLRRVAKVERAPSPAPNTSHKERYQDSKRRREQGLAGEGRLQGVGSLPQAVFAFVELVGEADEGVDHAFVARTGDVDAGGDEVP